MKKIILILSVTSILISCGPSLEQINKQEAAAPYKVGDIVFLKPDSARGVIKKFNVHCCGDNHPDYDVLLEDGKGNTTVRAELIYGKEQIVKVEN